MEYRDKRTLGIMSGFNDKQEHNKSRRAEQRERDRDCKKFVTDFFFRSITIIDKMWWSLLSDSEKFDIAALWNRLNNKDLHPINHTSKEQFLIDMKVKYDRRQQLRDKKLESLL